MRTLNLIQLKLKEGVSTVKKAIDNIDYKIYKKYSKEEQRRIANAKFKLFKLAQKHEDTAIALEYSNNLIGFKKSQLRGLREDLVKIQDNIDQIDKSISRDFINVRKHELAKEKILQKQALINKYLTR